MYNGGGDNIFQTTLMTQALVLNDQMLELRYCIVDDH